MTDLWVCVADELRDRVSGRMRFRLFLYPTLASFFAVRDALSDANARNPTYLWILIRGSGERVRMLKDGARSAVKVFLLAFALDVVCQGILAHWVYFEEAVFVVGVLAVAPYVVLRGVVTRLVRAFRHGQ